MFAAYSRRADHKTFTRINNWLARRDFETNPGELEALKEKCGKESFRDFYKIKKYPEINICKDPMNSGILNFRFESQVKSGFPENDVAAGILYLTYPISSPALLMIPGWLGKNRNYDRFAKWVARRGRNLWIIDPPFHNQRTPVDTRSGELFLTGDLVRSLNAIKQLVADCRVLIRGLGRSGVDDVALLGISLGGWAAGLLARLERNLSKMILVTPPLRPDKLLFDSPYFTSIQDGLGERFSKEYFSDLRSLILPFEETPIIDPDKIFILGAHEDIIAKAGDIDKLSSKMGFNHKILAGGHVTLWLVPRFWKILFKLINV